MTDVVFNFEEFEYAHFSGHQSHAVVMEESLRKLIVNIGNRKYAFRTTDVDETVNEINLEVNGESFGKATRTKPNEFKGTAPRASIDDVLGFVSETDTGSVVVIVTHAGWTSNGSRVLWYGKGKNRGVIYGLGGDPVFCLGFHANHDVGQNVVIRCNGQDYDAGTILQSRAPNNHWGPRSRMSKVVWNQLFNNLPADSNGWSMFKNAYRPNQKTEKK